MAPTTRHSTGATKSLAGAHQNAASPRARPAPSGPAQQQHLPTDNSCHDDDSMDVDVVGALVRLKTNDGKRFTLTESDVSCSNALSRMIESSRQNISNGYTEYIQLPTVDSHTLNLILNWIRNHCNNEDNKTTNSPTCQQVAVEPIQDQDPATCSHLDRNLTTNDMLLLGKLPEDGLLELMHASNYLDVRCLFNACSQIVAKRWESKKVEEIRRMYNIVGDFAPEEENQMIQECKKLGLNE